MELHETQRPVAVELSIPRAQAGERSDFYTRYGKRILDFTVAWGVLLLTAPLLALIALAVKLDSPGPVFFVQERVGKDGRLFKMVKFRTMRVNTDSTIHEVHVRRLIAENVAPQAGESLKLHDDPRITRLGRTLRRLSLDELPQFVNVLRGEMSVVGPRPELPYAVAAYPAWYHDRFRAMPGITGYWQVAARNRVSYEEMIILDIEYYERQSLWFDLALIGRTPFSMLSGAGAG